MTMITTTTNPLCFLCACRQAWDLGGHEAVRYLWFDFLSDSHAIVFMIDGADGERLEEAHWELSELLSDVSPTSQVGLPTATCFKQDAQQ